MIPARTWIQGHLQKQGHPTRAHTLKKNNCFFSSSHQCPRHSKLFRLLNKWNLFVQFIYLVSWSLVLRTWTSVWLYSVALFYHLIISRFYTFKFQLYLERLPITPLKDGIRRKALHFKSDSRGSLALYIMYQAVDREVLFSQQVIQSGQSIG